MAAKVLRCRDAQEASSVSKSVSKSSAAQHSWPSRGSPRYFCLYCRRSRMKAAAIFLTAAILLALSRDSGASWKSCGITAGQYSLYVIYDEPLEQKYNVGCATLNTINQQSHCSKKPFTCSNLYPKFVWQVSRADFEGCKTFFIDYCQDRAKSIAYGSSADGVAMT